MPFYPSRHPRKDDGQNPGQFDRAVHSRGDLRGVDLTKVQFF